MKVRKANIKISKVKPKKKNLTLIIALGLVIIAVTLTIFFGLSPLFKTQTYYVLRSDVGAKTQVTTGMLASQTTSAGTAPANAISIQDVQSHKLYTKYALEKGDVIARSNVGSLKNSTDGIPDSWVVTSFTSNSTDSVDGRIQRGSYFDIIGVDSNNQARYLFTDVLALDVSDTTSSSNGKSSGAYEYTVGMPAKDVALLHSALKKFGTIKLVMAPKSVSYGVRDTSGLGDVQSYNGSDPSNKDLFKGTDSTFAPVKRDKKGQPIKSNESSKLKADTTD